MIRRILVIGAVGLALAGGARFALKELAARAWEKRKTELAALAILPPKERRPWEVRFESLSERVRGSQRFDEVVNSANRPYTAVGDGEPRALDEFERLWLETAWSELDGLDGVLASLRTQPLEDLEWHGESQSLTFTRELTNALCGRAWLALEGGDRPAALLAWTDALRLARALDNGTILGAMIRASSENTVLAAVRSALQMGASPAALRAELLPYYLDWGNVAPRTEHAIRRELASVQDLGAPDDPAEALGYFLGLEDALARAERPMRELALDAEDDTHDSGAQFAWDEITLHFHDLHVRRNVAFTALAVAAHHEEHGSFPATLGEVASLEPEFTLDPRTETPLPYTTIGGAARVGPPTWVHVESDGASERASLYAWDLR